MIRSILLRKCGALSARDLITTFGNARRIRKYHHYDEERLISPNNYYSQKLLRVEPDSLPAETGCSCPNTNAIASINDKLVAIEHAQKSRNDVLEYLKGRNAIYLERIADMENKLHFIGFQMAVVSAVTCAAFIRG
jgi:hypothetical protein